MPALNNDQIDDQLLFERQESFAGGEDDYRRSTLIDPDQCQKLVNIIVRDNYEAWTRPGADLFAPVIANASVRSMIYFDTPTSKNLLTVCNGFLKSCSGANAAWVATGYTAAPDVLVEMAQGVDTILISDGATALAGLDAGLTLTPYSTGSFDPPVGANILCWHTGRMFAAGFSATRDTIWVSNLLSFGDGQWNGTTRSLRIGAGDGQPITAMQSMQGFILAVFKSNSVWLVNTDPTSQPVNFQLKTIVEPLGFGVGCVGKRAVCAVANDVFFMAEDGVRSLQRMEAAAGQWHLTAPLSQPVQQYINRINRSAQSNIAATSYKEFVFFAIPLDSSPTNNYTLVYNTRLGRWIGAWTGWTPTAFARSRFGNVEQLQIANSTGQVNLWKDASDTNNSSTYFDNLVSIPAKVWTRSYQFGEQINSKTAYNAVLRFTAGNSTAMITAVHDLADVLIYSPTFAADGDRLGFDRLGIGTHFKLASVKPIKVSKSLRSLTSFNEMFMRIETSSGWFKLRNITVSAFPNALEG